jgi:hypothetical protein
MTAFLPSNLLVLFQAGPPLDHLEPLDVESHLRYRTLLCSLLSFPCLSVL